VRGGEEESVVAEDASHLPQEALPVVMARHVEAGGAEDHEVELLAKAAQVARVRDPERDAVVLGDAAPGELHHQRRVVDAQVRAGHRGDGEGRPPSADSDVEHGDPRPLVAQPAKDRLLGGEQFEALILPPVALVDGAGGVGRPNHLP
jgi:hypothetical protein